MVDPGLFNLNAANVRLYAVLVLVSVAFLAILSIGAWIGYTMASTPAPKPIEEITTETEEKKKNQNRSIAIKSERSYLQLLHYSDQFSCSHE